MTADDWIRALEDPGHPWPEDVLSETEWEAGWLDRQIIAGARTDADRATTPRSLGGEA